MMAEQNSKYIIKKVNKCLEGKRAKGFFAYFNDLDKLCKMKTQVTSVEEFTSLDHLETALAVRSAYWVKKVVKSINESD